MFFLMKINKKILGVIPARSGSKRLKNKNTLLLNGKPLVNWTIEAATFSKYIDKVVVTSDSKVILNLASRYDVDTLIRPKELATDIASSIDVVLHAIEEKGEGYDYVILLQPTSPLRTAQHIDKAIEQLINKKSHAIISVCKVEHSPLWSNTLPPNGGMDNFLSDEVINKRSQDLPTYYRLNGAIYICEIKHLKENKSFLLKEKSTAYIMNRKSSIDIDSQDDLSIAEYYHKKAFSKKLSFEL